MSSEISVTSVMGSQGLPKEPDRGRAVISGGVVVVVIDDDALAASDIENDPAGTADGLIKYVCMGPLPLAWILSGRKMRQCPIPACCNSSAVLDET